MVIYEPFTPQQASGAVGIPFNSAPGHLVFTAQGMHVWERDVLHFLDRYLGPAATAARPEVVPE